MACVSVDECFLTAALKLKLMMPLGPLGCIRMDLTNFWQPVVAGFPCPGVAVLVRAFFMHQVVAGGALVGNCFLFHLIWSLPLN